MEGAKLLVGLVAETLRALRVHRESVATVPVAMMAVVVEEDTMEVVGLEHVGAEEAVARATPLAPSSPICRAVRAATAT